MNAFLPSHTRKRAACAFTLIEVVIALAVFAVGSTVFYQSLRANLTLMAKNISVNEGNANLQWSFYRLLSSLEPSAFFVDCANYNPSTQTFTAVASGTWVSAVTQGAPPRVEIKGFKVHHFLGLKMPVFECRKAARMGCAQLPESEFTRNLQKPLRAGMVLSPDCARIRD